MNKFISKIPLIESFLFLFTFFLYFYGLGSYGLLNNNEGLYAEIPREMILRGNYIIPHLNNVPYLEKPPLLYWLIALSYYLGGLSEFTARLVPAIAGFSLNLITYHFARHTINIQVARLSFLILSTMGGMIVFSRMIFFDVLLTFFLSTAFFSFYRWYQTFSRTNLRYFYSSLALAILCKGFIALCLACLVILIFCGITRISIKRIFDFYDGYGILLFLTLLLPWHILACWQDKDFFWFYFINEHILRFLGQRLPKDYYQGPIYYYIPRLFLTVFPWSFLFPFIFKKHASNHTLLTFLWVWVVTFFLFFSLSQAKANYYLVTILPPMAMILALKINNYANHILFQKLCHRGSLLFSLSLPILGLIACYTSSFLPMNISLLTEGILSWPLWLWLGLSFILIKMLKKLSFTEFTPWQILIAFQMAPVLWLALTIACKNDDLFSARAFIQQLPSNHLPLYLYRDFEKFSSIPFYIRAWLPLIDSHSNDLYFGLQKPENLSYNLTSREIINKSHQKDQFVIVFHEQKRNFEETYPQALLVHQKAQIYLYKLPKSF